MILFAILAIGCATLIVPSFTPPAPFYPTWFGFAPYVALFFAAFLARQRGEEIALVCVSILVVLIGCLYLDSIYFNRVFSWQVVGRVQDYLPAFQLAIAIPTLAVLLLRRWRLRDETHAA
ncbi:MAG: hypothetical protein ABI042_16265 [Verrucomicrobiota bacterium]